MGPTEIGMLIMGGIILMAVTSYVVQLIEAQRRERRMKLLMLKDQIRRADHLVHSLPAFFVTQDIRTLLLQYMEARWKQVIELDPTAEHRKQLDQIARLRGAPFDPGQYPIGCLTQSQDRETARRSRALLRELVQFLGDIQKAGMFSTAALARLTDKIKQSYTRLTIELELFDAQETEQTAGPQVALHQYRSCLLKLQGFNDSHQIDAQIFELSHKVEQCQAIADEIKAKADAEMQARLAAEREEERKKFPQ